MSPPLILLPDITYRLCLDATQGPKHVLVTDTDLKTDAQTYREIDVGKRTIDMGQNF